MLKCLFFVFLYCFLFINNAHATKINCKSSEKSSVQEKICKNEVLLKLDQKFDSLNRQINGTRNSQNFYQEIGDWQLERSYCITDMCLKNLYEKLIEKAFTFLWEAVPQYKKMRDECQDLALPKECEIYAYETPGLNINFAEFSIDENYETHLKEIKVNRDDKCVILALGSFEPTLWKIYKTPKTKIYGVILVYENTNQMLQGVPVGTKVYRNKCFNGRISNLEMTGLEIIKDQGNYIGEKLSKESYLHYPQNIDVTTTIAEELPNHEAVRDLVRRGVLSHVGPREIDYIIDRGYSPINVWGDLRIEYWKSNYSFSCRDAKSAHSSTECHHYVLQKPLEKLPNGVDGVYGIVIFVPDGMEPPKKETSTTSSIYRLHATQKQYENFLKKNRKQKIDKH